MDDLRIPGTDQSDWPVSGVEHVAGEQRVHGFACSGLSYAFPPLAFSRVIRICTPPPSRQGAPWDVSPEQVREVTNRVNALLLDVSSREQGGGGGGGGAAAGKQANGVGESLAAAASAAAAVAAKAKAGSGARDAAEDARGRKRPREEQQQDQQVYIRIQFGIFVFFVGAGTQTKGCRLSPNRRGVVLVRCRVVSCSFNGGCCGFDSVVWF